MAVLYSTNKKPQTTTTNTPTLTPPPTWGVGFTTDKDPPKQTNDTATDKDPPKQTNDTTTNKQSTDSPPPPITASITQTTPTWGAGYQKPDPAGDDEQTNRQQQQAAMNTLSGNGGIYGNLTDAGVNETFSQALTEAGFGKEAVQAGSLAGSKGQNPGDAIGALTDSPAWDTWYNNEPGKGVVGAKASPDNPTATLDLSVVPENSSKNDTDSMWADILAQQNSGYDEAMQTADASQARDQRRAAEMSAGMGQAAGSGGFASGQAQAQLTGQEQRLKAKQDYQNRSLDLKMTYLQRMLQRAEAAEDRASQEWIQQEMDKTQMSIETAKRETERYTTKRQAQSAEAIAGADYGGYESWA